MSWESLVRGMLADENPDLEEELRQEGEYKDYVEDVAERMRKSYEHATAGVTDPAQRATAREVAIAQAREEIEPVELLEYGEFGEDEAQEFLQDFYYGAGV